MPPLEPKLTSKVVQRDAKELANNYPNWFRKLEWAGLISVFILFILLAYKIILIAKSVWIILLFATISGYVAADFFSGVVHWLADTWGSPDIPILGAAIIRPFREHHVDQFAMTHHDFVETNAAAALAGLPLLVGCLFIPIGQDKPYLSFLFFFLCFLTFFTFMTNQIHKWSHSKKVPKIVRHLQKRHLILNPRHHQYHHTPPFNKNYCITTGWLNHFLNSIRFFPTCEKIISKYTGAVPRQDDIGENAAKEIISKNGKAS